MAACLALAGAGMVIGTIGQTTTYSQSGPASSPPQSQSVSLSNGPGCEATYCATLTTGVNVHMSLSATKTIPPLPAISAILISAADLMRKIVQCVSPDLAGLLILVAALTLIGGSFRFPSERPIRRD
jgi:hypothetical protein